MEIRDIDIFLSYYGRIRERTKRVVECIPRDHIDWTHQAGKFTFADLVRHIAAIERYMYGETVRGGPSRYPGCGTSLADGYDDVVAFMDRLHAESIEIFGSLTNDDLQAKCTTPMGTPITTWKWLRALIEHEVHHRGQMYLMLGMIAVDTPPLYGLTAEDVRKRSQA
jgi:uncharacterized damage-inducible protein DinB